MYEICFLFCLYYTLNLDPFLPREFTNVKQLPIQFISFQAALFIEQNTATNLVFRKNVREKSMFNIIYYMIENTDEC